MTSFFYKQGSMKAVQDLTGNLHAGVDNPTMALPKSLYAKKAFVELNKVARPLGQGYRPNAKRKPISASNPVHKSTRFKSMVAKLKKQKGKRTRAKDLVPDRGPAGRDMRHALHSVIRETCPSHPRKK